MLFKNIDILDENIELKKNMYVGIQDKKITYLDSKAPADESQYGETYDGKGKLLMNAFYNTHAHSPMSLLRGYAENLPLQVWLEKEIWPFEGKMVDGDFTNGAQLAMAEMIRYGVVSFSDMYFHGMEICKAAYDSGMKLNWGDSGTMFSESYETSRAYEDNKKVLENYHGIDDGRIIMDMVVHGEYTTNKTVILGVADFAREHNLRLDMHLSETKLEHEESKERNNGMTPAQYFESLGVFDIPTTLAHCVWIDDNDIEILAKRKVHCSINPASNCKLGSGIVRLPQMMEAGINCSMGTDGMASNNTHNLLLSAYLLGCLIKGVNQDPTLLPAQDIIRMLTCNGAKAQGRNDCGLLKVGNKADLIVLDIDNPWMQPVYDMPTNLIYSANGADVVLTMCDGKVLYKDGEYLTMDFERIKHNCKKSVKNILTALNE